MSSSDDTIKARVVTYEKARVKFNNGYGALLCNACSKIVKTGFDHPDTETFCSEECKPSPLVNYTYGYNSTDQDYFG